MTEESPKLVLVVGMHRSGTSLTTAVLHRLGAVLSDDLVEANEFNSMGYFESATVMRIHDEVLHALGSSWRMPGITHPLPDGWVDDPRIAPFRAELKRLVRRHTGGKQTWAVKDPRASRLLPLWNAIIDELAIRARYILVFRRPAEVAASLERRDRISRGVSDALWLEHNIEALRSSQGRLVAAVSHDDWFEDPVSCAEGLNDALGLAPQTTGEIRRRLDGLVSKSLRHHEEDSASNLPIVDELFDAMRRGNAAEQKRLIHEYDRLRRFSIDAGHAYSLERGTHSAIHDIHQRVAWREDVDESQAQPFLDAADSSARAIASIGLSRTAIRRALETIVSAAEARNFADPSLVTAAMRIAPLSDVDTPYIHLLKEIGIRAAKLGDAEQGVRLLSEALGRAFVMGEHHASKARAAFAYLSDGSISDALTAIAMQVGGAQNERHPVSDRVLLVCTSLACDVSGAPEVVERARTLRSLGFEVSVLVTGSDAKQYTYDMTLDACGAVVRRPSDDGAFARFTTALDYAWETSASAAVFLIHAQDSVGRMLGSARIAPFQLWQQQLLGPFSDSYDAVTELDYFALPEEFGEAVPLALADLEIPEDAPIVATIGRYAKCVQPPYLAAVARVLQANQGAYLVVSGLDNGGEFDFIRAYATQVGAGNRVRQLPAARWASLLRAATIYCDTAPWNGQRALLAAAYAGLPIVAFQASRGDATTCGFAARLLDGVAPLAQDFAEYAELAGAYLGDERRRTTMGRALKERCAAEFDPLRSAERLMHFIKHR